MTESLLTLFLPPEGYIGDFGLLCGFTASQHVLEQLKKNFSPDMSRPVLAAFLHPTSAAVDGIPGLAWMSPKKLPLPYALLHAKVALLGFRNTTGGYRIRVIVTTGNWTADPLTSSIDLYWSITLDPRDPVPQDAADIRAAWAFFKALKSDFDCSVFKQKYDAIRPDAELVRQLRRLPSNGATTRFIDSRKKALLPQVVERMKRRTGDSKFVLGSGYFEAGATDQTSVPERFFDALTSGRKAFANTERCIVMNPSACQGLATAAPRLRDSGWILRCPKSEAHGNADMKLHAKFALLTSVGNNNCCQGTLYLGSGNMTPAGFELAAGKGGNLEAGVVLDIGNGLQWGTKPKKSIYKVLPIGGEKITSAVKLGKGSDFEVPEPPECLPEIPYALWENGRLSAPDGKEVDILGPEGAPIQTPCDWPEAPPIRVTLRNGDWSVPVIAYGALVSPRPRDLTVEDILAGLLGFPEPADPEGRATEQEDTDDDPQSNTATVARPVTTSYPIRRMMGLLAPLAEVQKTVKPLDWPRWCRELQEHLVALRVQEEPMIDFFRRANADPLPILRHPVFCPIGVQMQLLTDALAAIARQWGLPPTATSLWEVEATVHEH